MRCLASTLFFPFSCMLSLKIGVFLVLGKEELGVHVQIWYFSIQKIKKLIFKIYIEFEKHILEVLLGFSLQFFCHFLNEEKTWKIQFFFFCI